MRDCSNLVSRLAQVLHISHCRDRELLEQNYDKLETSLHALQIHFDRPVSPSKRKERRPRSCYFVRRQFELKSTADVKREFRLLGFGAQVDRRQRQWSSSLSKTGACFSTVEVVVQLADE